MRAHLSAALQEQRKSRRKDQPASAEPVLALPTNSPHELFQSSEGRSVGQIAVDVISLEAVGAFSQLALVS